MTEWRWNVELPGPGYYWVYHDHWMDEEPYVIRAYKGTDGGLWYQDTYGKAGKVDMPTNFNYWRKIEVPGR